ncbi:MAG: hypothetical protein GF355_01425 [Candidatus Eisenbacteria bacterium]|nr:hypothetical protein [Candidatus Eisenbacteria bacterium]
MEPGVSSHRWTDTAVALLRHLRLPFQLVLAPIWLLGALTAGESPAAAWLLPFLAVHVGLYGGATAYNSYYDRDEGPIAFLKRAQPPGRAVRDMALGLQLMAAAILALLHPAAGFVAILMLAMGIAYSHPRWRWKSRTVTGLLVVACGQGAGAVLLGYYSALAFAQPAAMDGSAPGAAVLPAAVAAACVTAGVYPLTQVYQVDEDRNRGDRTIAVRYGWKAALGFSAAVSTIGLWLFAVLFQTSLAPAWFWVPLAAPAPLAAVLWVWARRFERQSADRNHDWAMGISAGASLVFWGLLLAVLVAGCASSVHAAPPPAGEGARRAPQMSVWDDNGLLRVEGSIHVAAPPDSVWSVLLDYERLPAYMPNVDSSRVLERGSKTVLVRQVGHGQFLFEKTFRFVLEFRRIDAGRVHFRQIRGDFNEFSGVWSVTAEERGARIGYRAALRHGLLLPGFLVRHILEEEAEKMLPALRNEVERRLTDARLTEGGRS